MLEPKRRKYRKEFRGKMRGLSFRASSLAFGDWGLKSLERIWLTARQIEAGRKVIAHTLKRGGKIWVRVFPDKPVTSRPAGQRMGGGKGEIDRYVCVVKPGRIIFEVAGASEDLTKKALKLAAAKLPVKTIIIGR